MLILAQIKKILKNFKFNIFLFYIFLFILVFYLSLNQIYNDYLIMNPKNLIYFPFIFPLVNYIPINNLSNKIKNNVNNQRFYSIKDYNDLHSWFVSGLSDSEGCFNIKISKSSSNLIGWQQIQIENNNNDNQLNPWFVTGYTDGEGCFLINV